MLEVNRIALSFALKQGIKKGCPVYKINLDPVDYQGHTLYSIVVIQTNNIVVILKEKVRTLDAEVFTVIHKKFLVRRNENLLLKIHQSILKLKLN
jgi:hypothetical protein